MTPLHDAAYKENNTCYALLNKWEGTDASIKESLRYTAEKLLCGYTGTNNDGSISYSGSTVAGAGGEPSMVAEGGEDVEHSAVLGGDELEGEEGGGEVAGEED